MRVVRWAAVAALIVVVASGAAVHAADKAQDLIVGKWEPAKKEEGVKLVIEFTKDGKVKINANAQGQEFKVDGKYKFLDDNTMQVEVEFMGKKDSKKVQVIKVTKEELVTKDEGAKDEEKLKRVK